MFVQLFKLGPLQFICVSDSSDSVKEVREASRGVVCTFMIYLIVYLFVSDMYFYDF